MTPRRSLLRGTAALALAAAIIGAGALAPVASAAPIDTLSAAEAIHGTMNKPKVESGSIPDLGDSGLPNLGELSIPGLGDGGLPNLGELSIPSLGDGGLPGLGDLGIPSGGDSGIGEVPIIGEVVNGFKDAEPEEIVSGAVEFAGVAAETVVPLIRGLIK